MIQAVFGGFGRFLHPFLLTTCDSADFVAIVREGGMGDGLSCGCWARRRTGCGIRRVTACDWWVVSGREGDRYEE